MNTLLLHTDGRPLAATQAVLSTYLPGLAVTPVPLDGERALVDASVLRALRLEYGTAGHRRVLAAAGVLHHELLGGAAAQALLDLRVAPPPRPALAAEALAGTHLQAVRAQRAWALLGGADALDWTGVRVGQADTGWTRHPALGFGGAAPSWVVVNEGLTDFAASNGDPHSQPGPGQGEDALTGAFGGHGTRTAGVISGCDGAYFGAAPRVPLVPVRIADHVWINHAQPNLARAITYLVDQARVCAINISMGVWLAKTDADLCRAVDHAYESGVVVVCAAGQLVHSVIVPARLPRTLAIAGVDSLGQPWTESARGATVDLSAPALDIPVARTRPNGAMDYDRSKGTSFASALTCGAVALWTLRHRGVLAAAYPEPWQRVEAVTRLLRQTAWRPQGWQVDQGYGSGVLDIEALLGAALPPRSSLQRQPTA